MARSRNRLSARTAANLRAVGRYADGGGLYLRIDGTGEAMSRRWVYRFTLGGKSREMGLGSFPEVSLADARRFRDEAERQVRDGSDPIQQRRTERASLGTKPTFGAFADEYIAGKQAEWRNQKHRDQWRMTLKVYAAPIRPKYVDEITTQDVLSLLEPIWTSKPETAARVRGRIESVLDAAQAKGLIAAGVANPARWRGHLDKLLPKVRKLSRGHHTAMPYADVPAFMQNLRTATGTSARALELLILTASRSGEIREATWGEFDLEQGIWTVPANRMKANREHRVPLSQPARGLLRALFEARADDGWVFTGERPKKSLSNMAMNMQLRRMGVDVTVHGFRSAFRDWAGNETEHPREIAEAALAHIVGDASERAYRRSDALEKRRKLMSDWAVYLSSYH